MAEIRIELPWQAEGALDLNDDISAYQAAFAYLEPAMSDWNMRVRSAPGYSIKDKERVRQAKAYVARFAVAVRQA